MPRLKVMKKSTPRILFLVKNYIGFGHIRRTLLIAEQISALYPSIEIIFISQAKSLLLFHNTPYRVINFPFLHRLPNNATASVYETLLNQIITNLNPTLVIEDTYPDEWYISVPAIQNIPKILILRRIDPLSLNNFRKEGYFSFYNRVLVVQDKEEFFAENHLQEIDLLVRFSDAFRFIGPVFHSPTDNEIEYARKKYARQGGKLIVINAGAGGDHFNDAYCERLFISVDSVAQQLQEQGEIKTHFVFVMGPYYKGIQPAQRSNVTIVDFEPNLSALLNIADIAIIRPGYNVTQETLAGSAKIILMPSASYMESQYLYAEHLAKKYNNVRIGNHDNPNALLSLVQELLETHSTGSSDHQVFPCQADAARAIIDELTNAEKFDIWNQQCEGVKLFLLIGNTNSEYAQKAWDSFQEKIPEIPVVAKQTEVCDQPEVINLDYLVQNSRSKFKRLPALFLQSTRFTSLTPEILMDRDVRLLLYTNRISFGPLAKEWCDNYYLKSYGILEIELYHFYVMPDRDLSLQLSYRISKLSLKNNPVAIYLDPSLLTSHAEIEAFINALIDWKRTSLCCFLSLKQMVRQVTLSKLG